MGCEDLLQRICADAPSAARFFRDKDVGIGLLRELGTRHLDEPGVDYFLASMPNTPMSIMEELIRRGDESVLVAMAQNNPRLHGKLLASPFVSVRCAIAAHRQLTPALAQHLAKDGATPVRMTLAQNPVIPNNIQLLLCEDLVPFVRMALLENRRLDEEFQIRLGDDIDTLVHLTTLLTPRLSAGCMSIWSKFDEEVGQLALARRKNLPPVELDALTKSKYPAVRLALLRYQELSDAQLLEYAGSGDESLAAAILSRPKLSDAVLAKLWQGADTPEKIQRMLAESPHLNDFVALAMLKESPSPEQLERLALNPSPRLEATRQNLAERGDSWLGKCLLANVACHGEKMVISTLVEHAPEAVLVHLVYRGIDCSGLTPAAVERLAKSEIPAVRKYFAAQAS